VRKKGFQWPYSVQIFVRNFTWIQSKNFMLFGVAVLSQMGGDSVTSLSLVEAHEHYLLIGTTVLSVLFLQLIHSYPSITIKHAPIICGKRNRPATGQTFLSLLSFLRQWHAENYRSFASSTSAAWWGSLIEQERPVHSLFGGSLNVFCLYITPISYSWFVGAYKAEYVNLIRRPSRSHCIFPSVLL
jgi:hypothetical protein